MPHNILIERKTTFEILSLKNLYQLTQKRIVFKIETNFEIKFYFLYEKFVCKMLMKLTADWTKTRVLCSE